MTLQNLNTKVIFEARRTTTLNGSGNIGFNKVEINIGDGFHAGVFTVPIDGIYRMTFSCSSSIEITVKLFKNGNYEMMIMEGLELYNANIESSTWMMTLVKGDKLNLKSSNLIYADDKNPLIFNGELIHID